MPTEASRETRSRSETRKELHSYVQSPAFVTLLDDAISKQFEKFFSSEDFKKMLVATTTSVASTIFEESIRKTRIITISYWLSFSHLYAKHG